MKKNEGNVDRIIRIVLGIVLLITAFAVGIGETTGLIALIVGIIALATGLLGWCGLYTLLGINTCKVKPNTDN